MPMLLTRARAAALHTFWQSRTRSITPLPIQAPGISSYDVLKYGLRPSGSGLITALMTQLPISQASTW